MNSDLNQGLKMRMPSYDKADTLFVRQVADHFLSLNPLLGNMSKMTSAHRGPIRNVGGEVPLDQGDFRITSESLFRTEDIRNSNLEAHTEILMSLVEQLIVGLSRSFFLGIQEITDATGQVLDAKGSPFTFDTILDMLEKMPVEFDGEGEPKLPTIVMHPKLFESVRELKITEEQRQRQEEILGRKKEEFYAQKRTRRLS